MALKTDYQNDVFTGKRKYKLTSNSDGTVSLDDVTVYNKTGDIFNADDINATNRAVNENAEEFDVVKTEFEALKKDSVEFKSGVNKQISDFKTEVNKQMSGLKTEVDEQISDFSNNVSAIKAVKTVTLATSKWSTSAPYTQTVSVTGVTSSDSPIIALYISGSPSAATVKAQRKAFGYLDRAVTGNGSITFYCYEKKPAADFNVSVKGE